MTAWGLGLAAALLFGCALPLLLRLGAVLLLAAALGPAAADLVRWRGRLRLGVDAHGRWWLRRAEGRLEYVQFGAPPLLLGDWVWLRLRSGRATTFLCIEGARVEPGAFRRLKLRLRLDSDEGVEGP